MPTTHRLPIETVRLDDEHAMDEFDQQVMDAGMKRVRADREKLRSQGLVGEDGKLRLAEPPAEMRPGSERDLGG